jgi:hypothetical protein
MNAVSALTMIDLIGAEQRVINTPDDCWHAIRRIEALIGIHLFGKVRVRRNLPAAKINRLQSGSDLLHRLVPGQRTECHYWWLRIEQSPEPFRPFPR